MKNSINKHIKRNLIILLPITILNLITSCSNGNSGGASIKPYITIESGDIKFYFTSATILPTQYLEINLKGLHSNATYDLQYNSPTLGTKQYHLCSTSAIESSCFGKISLSSLLVYNPGDSFVILQNNQIASVPVSGDLLIKPIVLTKKNTAWVDYHCGLTSVTQQAPLPTICDVSNYTTNQFKLNISNGCNTNNMNVINANVAIYWPEKFNTNNYGITCTGIPIGESWVITAGHCVGSNGSFYQNGVKIYVSSGMDKLPIEIPESQIKLASNTYEVESIYLLKSQGKNENCNNKCSLYADIALLHMKNYKFSNIISLVAANEIIAPQTKGIISGFGMHNESTITGIIRNGKFNYRDAYFVGESDSVVYSTGTLPDNSNYAWKFTSFGDSGGPIFIEENNRLKLLGTLTGGTYLDGYSGINCKYPGSQNEYSSMRYWGTTITAIMNGVANPELYNVTN